MLTPERDLTRPATPENLFREGLLYGNLFLAMDPVTGEFRLLSQDHFHITVTPKGFSIHPTLPSEVVPHG